MTDPRTKSSSIFTRGAVDLSALRAAPPTPAPAPPAPAPAQPAATSAGPAAGGGSGGVTIVDVTEATFQSEVLERSLHTPVVIDFWAEWCGPCKQLSPILEKLAIEGDGAWVLARVDVDANERLAAMFRVQGIPMVYAVVRGQPVDAFTGVVPEAQLRQWIVGLLRRVQGVNPAKALADAAAVPDDIAKQALAADVEVVSGRAEEAYRRMVELVRRTSGAEREAARQHLVSLFTVAGPDDPAVASARRQLASALF